YRVKITRKSGPTRLVPHRLSWLGNDGTFTAPPLVLLPLNKPVEITVWARPKAGVHSAILRVDDPSTSTVDLEVLHTVVAAQPLAPAGYSYTASGKVDRNATRSYFVFV